MLGSMSFARTMASFTGDSKFSDMRIEPGRGIEARLSTYDMALDAIVVPRPLVHTQTRRRQHENRAVGHPSLLFVNPDKRDLFERAFLVGFTPKSLLVVSASHQYDFENFTCLRLAFIGSLQVFQFHKVVIALVKESKLLARTS